MGAALEKARVVAQIVGVTATSAVTRAASAVTTAAQAATTAATVVATSSVIGTVMVGGVVIFKSASALFDLLQTYFSKPPQYPPTAPHYEKIDSLPPYCSLGPEPMTQDKLILLARERLDMDVMKQYNFGVCGQSGTGKSTFINCMRNLKDIMPSPNFKYRADAAAPVGRGPLEVTNEIRRYIWPNNASPYIAFWDLPGGGTSRHPSSTYYNDKVLYAFDCILLLTTARFTELDFNIVQEACEYGTPIILVLTKVDQEVIKEFEDNPEKPLEDVVKEIQNELKEAARKKLSEINLILLKDVPIFAVSATKFRRELSKESTGNCSSLDMWDLIQYCLTTAYGRRVPPTGLLANSS